VATDSATIFSDGGEVGVLIREKDWSRTEVVHRHAPTQLVPGESAAPGAPAAADPVRHILVVDDNADIRERLARHLRERWSVTTAVDGASALAAVQRARPDLIVSDVVMPGIDGFELLRRLRADRATRAIPVIMLTAEAGGEASIEGLNAGADDYVVKPFSARELVARVATHLELVRLRTYASAEQQREKLAHLGRVAMLGEMSAALAHELRQPLMAIRSYAQGSLRFIRAAEPNKASEGLEAILRAEKHAARVIDRVRTVLKRNEPRTEELNVDDIVREALELAAVELQQRGVSLVANLGASQLTVLADRSELQQVLMNVILNGCEAMAAMARPQKRLVVTTTQSDAEQIQIQVRDEGTGIPEDHLDRVFEPFASTKHERLGLGLAICRSIVRSHGGEIRASNNSDRGSTFSICLPRLNRCSPSLRE
jgi:C4-dicarboxylate-specific signal transduction histidine kinase